MLKLKMFNCWFLSTIYFCEPIEHDGPFLLENRRDEGEMLPRGDCTNIINLKFSVGKTMIVV